ncbi:MAG: magnesium transporter MgtE N-terminal domain-containing protein [Propionibacteriaceae bacterium]
MPSSSIFLSRLRGLPVVDSAGSQVGKVRDVVLQVLLPGRPPRAKGLVVELFARHRIFVPIARVHQVDASQVAITGLVDTRKFSRRPAEMLVIEDLFDRRVTVRDGSEAQIYDIGIRLVGARDWELAEFALTDRPVLRFGRKPHIRIVEWTQLVDLSFAGVQDTATIVAQMEEMNPADLARELHDLQPARRAEVANALDDEVLAGALEELPEDEQIALIEALEPERAADVLEEMDPDDAADLIAELRPEKAEELLDRMEPEEANDVRYLLSYAVYTAGGMMTPEPVIVAPDATVADALAQIRNENLTPALASTVFVCRTPLDVPTGRWLGGVHFQRLLREPPSTLVGSLLDERLEPLNATASLAEVSRYFATYNLVIAPVVDADSRLLGAVTVDDVLDHMLPEDWRGEQMDQR